MPRLPDQIGKYDVVERIGKGGMGMVYKAKHPTLDRFVILKKLNISGDQVIRERFRREAEIMIDFRTDYVVDVYDHFKHASSDYIVLEYIDGLALDELLAKERYLSNDLALLVARDCFRGLDYVHRKGVVHRDMKPGNVLIGRDGAVKLLDFGIASRVAGFEDDLTRDGMTLGTVAYIAPEQIERSRDVDRRADIYSTGAMLYEVATGRKPFSGGFNPETVNRIQRGRFRRPRRVNPRVSRLTSRIIMRCMRRKPKRRYQSAAAVVTLLDAYFRRRGEHDLRARLAELAGGDEAASSDRTHRRRRLGWLIAAAATVLVAGALTGWATGTVQRLVLGRSHALAQLEIRLRKSERTVGEHLIRTELVRLEDGEHIPVPVPVPLLHPVGGLETPDFIVLRSRLLTLPAGRYEARFLVEESVTRETRSLLPAAVEPDPQLLVARWDPALESELRLVLEAYDSFSGEPLSDVEFELDQGGRWATLVPRGSGWSVRTAIAAPSRPASGIFVETPSGSGETGSSVSSRGSFVRPVRFAPGEEIAVRASHPDYLDETVRVETESGSEAASIRFGLVPRPAIVLINSRVEDASLLVDGEDRIRAPGVHPSMVDVPELFEGVNEISLVPGSHVLTVRSGGADASLGVALVPGATLVLRVDETGDGIRFVIVEER